MGFPGGSVVKNLPANAGDGGSTPYVRKIPWKRKWQPTPVFLPGKPHGQKSLLGHSPWDHKESDTTEQLTQGMCPRSPQTDEYQNGLKVVS